MDTYEKILVIFLSSALAVLLVLSIVVLVKLLQIMKKVDTVTTKAEHLVDKASNLGSVVKQLGGPFVIGRFIMGKLRSKKAKRE